MTNQTRPPPPTTRPRAIIPDARPLGTFEKQDKVAVTVRRGTSKRSHEKIGDCEQSKKYRTKIRETQNLNTWSVDLGLAVILSTTWWNST